MIYSLHMPYFFIFFLIISFIGVVFCGVLLWNIIRMIDWKPLSKFVFKYRKIIKLLWYGVLVLLPITAVGTYIVSSQIYHPFLSFVYMLSIWGLGIGGYFLAASILSWFIGVCISMYRCHTAHTSLSWSHIFIPFEKTFTRIQKIAVGIPVLLACCIIIYGTVNAQLIRTTRYTLSASAGKHNIPTSWIGKKIVIYSDTHIGTIRKQDFLKRVVSAINNENPYITIMAGDLIDGPKFPHKYLSPLQNLKATKGNYFIPGNHEQYSRDPHIGTTIDNYITRIADDSIVVDGVRIIGLDYNREDISTTQSKIKLLNQKYPDHIELPTIGVVHDPKNISALIDNLKPNMTASGHTHGGQIWPGTILVKKIYGIFSYGSSYHNANETLHITTSGVGTAQTPMRIGTKAEIAIVTIVE